MFDHKRYLKQFLGKPGCNDAARLGVTIVPAPAGKVQAHCIGVHVLTGDENRGLHNVYFDVVDEVGDRVPGAAVVWMWFGREGDPLVVVCDKPEHEPYGNYPMGADMLDTECWVLGTASAHVRGLTTRHPDEPPGNTWGHWSYYVVFQLKGNGSTPPPEPTPGPTTPGDNPALDALRLKVANEIAEMRDAINVLNASLCRLEDAID
jgi:hypothetical protein